MKKGYVSFKSKRKSNALPELKTVYPRWHPAKGFYKKFTQYYWDGDKLKNNVDELPNLEPSKLNSELLWDSYDQIKKYPERFERWMLEEADMYENASCQNSEEYGCTRKKRLNQSKIKRENQVQELFPLKEKKNIKPPEQLSLFR